MRELFRNFWTTLTRFKTSSLLNVAGMAVAFASLYIIFVQVNYDLFYNRNLTDSENIYRVEFPSWSHEGKFTPYSSRPVTENCVRNIAAVKYCGCGNMMNNRHDCSVMKDGQEQHFWLNACRISIPFMDVFDFQCLAGNLKDIEMSRTVALSASAAKRLNLTVGDRFYMDKTSKSDSTLLVAAIFADFPSNTDLSFLEVVFNIGDQSINDDGDWSYYYYVKLAPGNNPKDVVAHANANWKRRIMESGETEEEAVNSMRKTGIRFVAISDTYFRKDIDGGCGRMGNLSTTYTLLGVSILILIITFVNFVNFFFALVPVRIRSINTHKIFGCSLAKLRSMLIFESLGLIVLALIVACGIILCFENTSLGKLISAPLNFTENMGVAALTVGIALAISFIASLYPAYYITSFAPAMAIKNSFGTSKAGQRLRYALVGLQFTISIALIICAFFVRLQHNFMMDYNMGFNKEYVLTSRIPGKISSQQAIRNAFDSKLKSNSTIKDVAWADGQFVAENRMGWGRELRGKYMNFQCYPVSWNFLQFMGLKIVEGRNFFPSDELKENGTFIFNVSAKKSFDLKLEDKMNGHLAPTDIAGFCNDFNFRPLQYGIEPFAFFVFGSNPWRLPSHLYIKATASADIKQLTEYLRASVAEFDPDVYVDGIDLKFFDEELQDNYEKENKLSLLITLFSVLAIIISLMGVFGLVMFETQYRMKEIAVRRVHGATVSQILKIFNSQFIKIIVACFVIAAPISYCIIDYWLNSFAYRMPIYWWVFAVALAIVLIITIATVTARCYSAATSDPAKLVKTE